MMTLILFWVKSENKLIYIICENRSAGHFAFIMIRGLVDQIDHLSRGEAWDLAALLSDETDAQINY